MPKKSSARSVFRPIDLAERLIVDAHEQIEAERHAHDLMGNLDAAEEIFALNRRPDRLVAISEYRPIVLLARGDRAPAVAASLRAYNDLALSAKVRLRTGVVALFALGMAEDRSAGEAHIRGYAKLSEEIDPDADALTVYAALARCHIYIALTDAGMIAVPALSPTERRQRTVDSVYEEAAELLAWLEGKIRQAGAPAPNDPSVLLTQTFLRCAATKVIDVSLAFAQARQVIGSNRPITSALLEGRAHLLHGHYDRAVPVLKAAVEHAKAGAVLHLQAAAHFQIAMALSNLGHAGNAWTHVLHYCAIQHAKLSRSVLHAATMAALPNCQAPWHSPHPSTADHLRHAQSEPPYLKRALRYIELHVHEDVNVESIVTASGVSRRTLELAFRSFRAMSPIAYLRQTRLDRAHQLLVSTELSIGQIRDEVGYRNASMFSRDFRSHFGVSPLVARRSSQKPLV